MDKRPYLMAYKVPVPSTSFKNRGVGLSYFPFYILSSS